MIALQQNLRTIRIAVIFDTFGPYHVARIEALGRRVATLGLEVATRSDVYEWDKVEAGPSFERRTLFDVKGSSQVTYLQVRMALARELADFRPDAVLVPGWASRAALAALDWCLEQSVPAVVMSESTRADHARVIWKEALKRQVVACFGAGIVGGEPQRAYLASLGVPRRAIVLGYNAVDNAYFASGAALARADAAGVRSRLEMPQRFFLASSRFIAIKNLVGLLEAFAAFRRLRPASDIKLVLLGDGERRSELEALRISLDLADWVVLPGFRQYAELPAFYGLADGFVHVARIEPWGLVVNEAMAAGLPVVVSKECGCADMLVEDEGNGFVVAHNDIEAIAERLALLDDSAALRTRMGQRSRAIIEHCAPDRFGEGALEAAAAATARGPLQPNILQRAALRAIAARL